MLAAATVYEVSDLLLCAFVGLQRGPTLGDSASSLYAQSRSLSDSAVASGQSLGFSYALNYQTSTPKAEVFQIDGAVALNRGLATYVLNFLLYGRASVVEMDTIVV